MVPSPPTKRLGRPQRCDSAATRDRLVVAARQQFARNGFDGTTNRAIAADAGITTGAIYHYFESKAELYEAVYCLTLELVQREFQHAADGKPTLFAQLEAIFDAAVRLNREDPSVTGFVVAIARERQRHPELSERLGHRRTLTGTLFRRLIAEARDRGELAPDVDAKGLEDLINCVMSGLARFSTASGDWRRHAAAVEALKRVLGGTLLATRA